MGKRIRVLIALGIAYLLTIALPASVLAQDCNPQKVPKIVQEAINKTDSLVLPKGEVKIVAPLNAGLGDGDNFRRITEQQAEALQRLAASGAIVVRVLQAPRTSPGPVDLNRMMNTAISGTISICDCVDLRIAPAS